MPFDNYSHPVGYQQITTLSAAVGLTLPTSAEGKKVRGCWLQAETQNVRWRDDGTDPVAGVGMILIAGQEPFFYSGKLSAIKFIEAAASAKLNVWYVR